MEFRVKKKENVHINWSVVVLKQKGSSLVDWYKIKNVLKQTAEQDEAEEVKMLQW